MSITVDRKALSSLLQIAAGVARSRSPVPELMGVRLSFTPESKVLVIESTDGERRIVLTTAMVDGNTPFSALLTADILRRCIGTLSGPTVKMEEYDRQQIRLADDTGAFELFGMDPANLAEPAKTDTPLITVDSHILRTMLVATKDAASTETSRYAMAGVALQYNEQGFRAMAVDERRLHVARAPGLKNKDKPWTRLLPASTVGTILTLIERVGDPAPVQVSADKDGNVLAFNFGDYHLTSSLIEGSFPPVDDVWPKGPFAHSFTVNADALSAAVRAASVLTTAESRAIRLEAKGQSLTLTSRAPELGTSTRAVQLVSDATGTPEFSINPKFADDALSAIGGTVVMETEKVKKTPIVFRAAEPDPKAVSVACVVMPVNLPE